MSPSPLIHLDAVSKVFYTEDVETHALNSVHLQIREGEFVAIAAPPGVARRLFSRSWVCWTRPPAVSTGWSASLSPS